MRNSYTSSRITKKVEHNKIQLTLKQVTVKHKVRV